MSEEVYFEEEEEEITYYPVEWLSDLRWLAIEGSSYEIWFHENLDDNSRWHRIKGVCDFMECPSYCGGLIIKDIKCTTKLFKAFIKTLKKDTPYSQLICGDINNGTFLACGAIDLGGVLLLEITNG